MPVPDRYRSAFSPSTLKTIETHASRFRVTSPLFFRSAYTANVTESERRTFQPVVVLEAARVLSSRCTCVAWMRADDLCRHAAVLLEKLTAEDGTLPAERFDASVWRAIAFASFTDGREMSAQDGDPREELLRKYVMTDQEQALLKRGSGSTRLQFEASPWYRWSKQMFLGANGAEARLELRDRDFGLRVGESLVTLPEAAVEHVVNAMPDIVAASGFEIAPQSLTPSLRIEITRTRALRFSPVLLGSGGVVLDRALTPKYGRFFFAGGRFASPATAAPMFAEKSSHSQGLLFEVRASAGVPYDRETVLAEEDVFAFVERHRDELAKLPPSLAPETLRNAQPVRLEGEVIFDFTRTENDFLEVQITFETGAEPIVASEIARARRDGVRALIRGTMWIDVTDPQFAWLDDATIG
ncbi:MAG TPA: SWIM zinc finger family protein, partial [Thermoanaerobaculia bacterium]